MTPRASTRISIRWPPAPAEEPTDTLVLSVGEYYVDLRVKKSDGSIDWALAGLRIVISENPGMLRHALQLDEICRERISHFHPSLPSFNRPRVLEKAQRHLCGEQ